MSAPALVTVLLPVYNSAGFVGTAIDSIRSQTFRDWELLIIDDGSSDDTAQVIQSIKDPRIRLERNNRNMGLAATLNRGLDMTESAYIARMDADDISLTARLQRQVSYLDENPDVGLVGTWVRKQKLLRSGPERQPTDPDDIAAELLFANCIAHPTVMLRREVLETNKLRYDPDLDTSQDFELWTRLARVSRLATLPQALLDYGQDSGSISVSRADRQRQNRSGILTGQLRDLDPQLDETTITAHVELSLGNGGPLRDHRQFCRWVEALMSLADQHAHLSRLAVTRAISRRIFDIYPRPGIRRASALRKLAAIAGQRIPLASLVVPRKIRNFVRYKL